LPEITHIYQSNNYLGGNGSLNQNHGYLMLYESLFRLKIIITGNTLRQNLPITIQNLSYMYTGTN